MKTRKATDVMSNQKHSAETDLIHAEASEEPMLTNPERLIRSNGRLIAGRNVTLPHYLRIVDFVGSVKGELDKDVIDDDETRMISTRGSVGTPFPPVVEAKNSSDGSDNGQGVLIPPYTDKTSSDTSK